MAEPQSYKNHTRFEPGFHFLLVPVLLLNIVVTVVWYVHHHADHPHIAPWLVLMSVVLLLMLGTTRRYAAHNQDRLIRLEERLRYALLLPAAELPLVENLSVPQIVALRFASDAELPALALRAAGEKLTPKPIKQSIQTWRADNFRV